MKKLTLVVINCKSVFVYLDAAESKDEKKHGKVRMSQAQRDQVLLQLANIPARP